jgi:integrase
VQGGGQIKTAWAAAVTSARIEKPISPHTLRHTWASWHYAMHRDLLLLKRDGGWASVAMVERYAHLAPAIIAPAAQAWRGTFLTQPAPSKRFSAL